MLLENKKYILWLDLMRVVSIFMVIIIHAASPLYNNWKDLPRSEWMAGNIYNSIARVSVPLLFMISGYLLLSRQEDIRSFYMNRVRKVVVPLLAWSVIYLIWVNNGYANYTFINAIKAIVLVIITKPAYYHLWFVYALLAIYMLVPVLRVFVRAADEATLRYFALIWFVFGPLRDFVAQKILGINLAFDLGFFNEYIGYFYLGYVLGRWKFSQRVTRLAGLTYVLLVIYIIYATCTLSAAKGSYNDFYLYYLRLSMVAVAIVAFIWLKHAGESLSMKFGEKFERSLRRISASTFGIYLIHAMILALLKWGSFGFKLTALSAPPIIMVPLLTLVVFLISYIIVSILQRIPFLRAIVPG